MKTYQFKSLLTNQKWISDAFVTIDNKGIITAISEQKPSTPIEFVNGIALPSFYNAHSHAFQYAMAGLAEKHDIKALNSDFWSWREAMYQLALSINPDDMEAIATMLYAEMLRHGYTQVAEFHYVHHDKNGNPYSNLSEMGERMVAAAQKAGIRITLIPIFYQKGGFGKPPLESQKRFISPTIDDYFKLFEASEKATQLYQNANIALGIHSLRGVEPSDILKVIEQGNKEVPLHIHIAEQLKEIEDALNYLGKRPVEWLCDNAVLDSRFQLVHATHLTDNEVKQIVDAQAQVVLCPSTEGNLGDGIFPLRNFQELGGKWCIGTDSHIGLNPMEEFRILDYGQRLVTHKRNTFTNSQQGNSALYGLEMAINSGRKAGNNKNTDFFKIGEPLDAIVYDASIPLIATSSEENLANTIVYASDSSWNLGTLVAGNWVVLNGKHINSEEIQTNFIQTLKKLKSR